MQQYVSVRTDNSGTVPAMILRVAGDLVLVRFASGVSRIVGCSAIAPATQPEILDYIGMAANYEPMTVEVGKT